MAISYSTHITRLDSQSDPMAGTVTNVRGYIYGEDSTDGKNTTVRFTLELPTPEEGSSFIPYESLTEAQVITWVESLMPPQTQAQLKKRISDIIESMRTGHGGGEEPEQLGLPWPVPEPTPIGSPE